MNKRRENTLSKIRNAFERLIERNNDSNPSIKEITAEAGINRKTFYLYFDCIETLFQDLENRTEQKLIDILEKKYFFDKNFSLKEFLNSLLELINTNNALYEKLLVDDRYKFVFRNIKDRIKERLLTTFLHDVDSIDVEIKLDFIFAGLIKGFRVWQGRKNEVTLEELYKATYSIIRYGISDIDF